MQITHSHAFIAPPRRARSTLGQVVAASLLALSVVTQHNRQSIDGVVLWGENSKACTNGGDDNSLNPFPDHLPLRFRPTGLLAKSDEYYECGWDSRNMAARLALCAVSLLVAAVVVPLGVCQSRRWAMYVGSGMCVVLLVLSMYVLVLDARDVD